MQSYSESDRHSGWVTPGQVASRLSSLSVRIGVRSCRQPAADAATLLTSLCCSLSHYTFLLHNLAVLPGNWESAEICLESPGICWILLCGSVFPGKTGPYGVLRRPNRIPNRIPTVHSHMAWLGCDVARKCSKVDWAAKAPAAMWYHSNLSALAFH